MKCTNRKNMIYMVKTGCNGGHLEICKYEIIQVFDSVCIYTSILSEECKLDKIDCKAWYVNLNIFPLFPGCNISHFSHLSMLVSILPWISLKTTPPPFFSPPLRLPSCTWLNGLISMGFTGFPFHLSVFVEIWTPILETGLIPKPEFRDSGVIPLLNHNLRWPRLRSLQLAQMVYENGILFIFFAWPGLKVRMSVFGLSGV